MKRILILAAVLAWASGAGATVGGWNYPLTVNTGVPLGTTTMSIDSTVIHLMRGNGTVTRVGTASTFKPVGFDTARWSGTFVDSLNPFRKFTLPNADSNFTTDYAPGILALTYAHVAGDTTARFCLPTEIGTPTMIRRVDTLTVGSGTSPWDATSRDSVLGLFTDARLGGLSDKFKRWTQAQVDSLLNAIRDGASGKNNFKANVAALALQTEVLGVLDSLGTILDSLRNLDNWVARQDSTMKTLQATRLVALHQGAVPEDYDSAKVVMYPGNWTPSKDSLKVLAYRAAAIDTIAINTYQWDYYVVGSDSTAVADTVSLYK